MKRSIAVAATLVLAAVHPLAAQTAPPSLDCGGCWGTATCAAPAACPAGARHVTGGGSMSLIQSAVNAAASGAVICVGPGTYVGNLNFHGKAVTVKASSLLGATLKGGTAGVPVVTFDTDEGSASVLEGFVVTGGSAPVGGGILIVNASPTIESCLIEGNTATKSANPRGGGAYIGGSEAAPSILCTCFQKNHADYAGGGLSSNYLAHPYLDADTFAGNTASFGGGYSAAFSGTANIEQSEFLDNSSIDGAGIHVLTEFGHTFVRRTVFKDNSASGNGGGAWVPAGFATVLNSVFDGNSAANGGGAATAFDGVLTVESSIFEGNSGNATLVADTLPGTTLVNNFNLFFDNTPASPAYLNTTGDASTIVLASSSPFAAQGCYVLRPGSQAQHTGLMDLHFDNPNGTRNSMGVGGGPVVP